MRSRTAAYTIISAAIALIVAAPIPIWTNVFVGPTEITGENGTLWGAIGAARICILQGKSPMTVIGWNGYNFVYGGIIVLIGGVIGTSIAEKRNELGR